MRETYTDGAIVVTVHLGRFELAVLYATQVLSRRVTVPVAQLSPPWRQTYFDAVREACGFDLVASKRPAADLVPVLRDGQTVVLMADRRPHRGGIEVDFLGHPARISDAAARLAAATGAPVFSVATTQTPAGDPLLIVGPKHSTDGTSAGNVALLQTLTLELTAAIQLHPHLWQIPADLGQLPWHALGQGQPMGSAR